MFEVPSDWADPAARMRPSIGGVSHHVVPVAGVYPAVPARGARRLLPLSRAPCAARGDPDPRLAALLCLVGRALRASLGRPDGRHLADRGRLSPISLPRLDRAR